MASELINAQAAFLIDAHHQIQVSTYTGGHDAYSKRVVTTDPSEIRTYNCLIQPNEGTDWTVASSTDKFPYIAYVLSIPVGGTDAYPIRAEEQIQVLEPAYLTGLTRRLGLVKTYPDQYGNIFVQTITFE
jgi:hypothetical protein